jgi:hypothetical protein
MSQNMKLLGVKLPPPSHDAVLQAASLKGISVSQYCREQLEKSVQVDPTSMLIRAEFKAFAAMLAMLAKGGQLDAAMNALDTYLKDAA